ncbi:Hypothetical protein BIBO1_0579 [Brucella inopinata BO1]|nr:Hypothetical protein BIBO1_0579 [Brucella inopinata BO1]
MNAIAVIFPPQSRLMEKMPREHYLQDKGFHNCLAATQFSVMSLK